MRAYCACLGMPHFHWLTFVRNLAVSSITARLRTSIEFTVIPKRAQYARISNKVGEASLAIEPVLTLVSKQEPKHEPELQP